MKKDTSEEPGDVEMASKEDSIVTTTSIDLGHVNRFRGDTGVSSSMRGGRRTSLNLMSREKADLIKPYLSILLFTGSIHPRKIISPWWICWIGWRFLVVIACLIPIYTIWENINTIDSVWVQIPAYLVPLWMATVGAGAMWYWLPSRIAEVMENGEPLTADEAKKIIRIPAQFIGFWIFTGVVTVINDALSASLYTHLYLNIVFDFSLACATAPVLGAVLLAVAVDSKQAQKEVFSLGEAARKKKLTRYMYKSVSDGVVVRRKRWKWPLRILAALSIYSALGLLYSWRRLSLGNHEKNIYDYDDETTSHLQIQLSAILYLGKEAVLLFLLMLEVTRINDEADSITTILNEEVWGPPGSVEESIRTDLLFLTTAYSVRSEALHGNMKQYLTTARSKPISFTLLGIRLTRDYVLALAVSFLLALTNVVLQALVKNEN